ncbi:hypothetical protein [Streptomyces sp. NPDC007070]|uniref:hypothetical protein n=1 Tax=Streptomyces sp. NPDC007070 TaxID=3154312 RepID=UPI00340B9A7B
MSPTLLKHKGRPVPYIAPWSAEYVPLPRLMAVAGMLHIKGQRRAAGTLWRPWLDKRGTGEPDYGDVHGPRQRECMLRMLCQVCGVPVARDQLGWPWLLEAHHGDGVWPEREVTTHPPTCEQCQPVAQVQCRPNRSRFASLRVGRVLADGVYGQLFRPSLPRPVPIGRKQTVYAGDPQLRWMLAGQMAATLLDVTVVDMHTQKPAALRAAAP